MYFILKIFLTALVALGAHLGIIAILAGGPPPVSGAFLQELAIRWTIAALFAHSISWPMPLFVNSLIVGLLTALNMAFIVLTFQGQLAFFQRALLTNGTGAIGLAAGAALTAFLIRNRGKA